MSANADASFRHMDEQELLKFIFQQQDRVEERLRVQNGSPEHVRGAATLVDAKQRLAEMRMAKKHD